MINIAPISIVLLLVALFAWRAAKQKRDSSYASLPFRNLNRSNRPGHVNEFIFKDRVFFHEYTFSHKTKAVEDLVIYTEVNTHTHLKVIAGKKLKSSALGFGSAFEYDTGDSEFDEAFFVSCDNPKIKNDVFGNANVRHSILKSMLSSSSKITLIDGLLKFSIPVVHFREIKELESGERIYTALSKIAEQLPKELSFMRPVTVGPVYNARDWATISPLILAIIATLIWQAGATYYEAVDLNSLFLAAISIALPLGITYVALSLKALKKPTSNRRQYSYIIIAAVTAIPLLSLGLLILINGHFDTS
jgi:predicted RND superfamily exporter protein